MQSKKRVVLTLLLAVCLTFLPVFEAFAAGANDGIMPIMDYINDASYNLWIDNNVADVEASVYGHTSATKCEIEVKLQEKGLIFWSTYDSWSVTENSYDADLYESVSVNAGKSYRIKVTFTVWSGSESETRTFTSSTVVAD